MSKDEFAEYEHGANESHGDDECRDANEDGAAAGKAKADVAAADDAVAGANAGSGALLGNRAPSGVACRIRTRYCRRASNMRALSPRSESTAHRALRKIGSTTTRK